MNHASDAASQPSSLSSRLDFSLHATRGMLYITFCMYRWDDPAGTENGIQLATVPSTMVRRVSQARAPVRATASGTITSPASATYAPATTAVVAADGDGRCIVCNGVTQHVCGRCAAAVHTVAKGCGRSLSGGDGSNPNDLVCVACWNSVKGASERHSDSSDSDGDSDSQKRYYADVLLDALYVALQIDI